MIQAILWYLNLIQIDFMVFEHEKLTFWCSNVIKLLFKNTDTHRYI
jgi:hypothetical protein